VGTPACGGSATARATILADISEAARLARGDILVTKQTDPGWAPAFFLVSGLVVERGGMLSHGAIVAREFGIPCVVGARGATTRIASGSTITVDGDAGHVHLA
jgi:pyruvate,water dikinase